MHTSLRYVSAPSTCATLALAVCFAFVMDSVAHKNKAGQPQAGKVSAEDKYSLQVPNGFNYDPASDKFTPDGSSANCGFACHSRVAGKDYIFTAYEHR